MNSEMEKMIAAVLYQPGDPELVAARQHAQALMRDYNATIYGDPGREFGKPISIGRNVWIGGAALLLPGVTVGDDAIIGAGSVVTRDVAAGSTVAGNPARVLHGATA